MTHLLRQQADQLATRPPAFRLVPIPIPISTSRLGVMLREHPSHRTIPHTPRPPSRPGNPSHSSVLEASSRQHLETHPTHSSATMVTPWCNPTHPQPWALASSCRCMVTPTHTSLTRTICMTCHARARSRGQCREHTRSYTHTHTQSSIRAVSHRSIRAPSPPHLLTKAPGSRPIVNLSTMEGPRWPESVKTRPLSRSRICPTTSPSPGSGLCLLALTPTLRAPLLRVVPTV